MTFVAGYTQIIDGNEVDTVKEFSNLEAAKAWLATQSSGYPCEIWQGLKCLFQGSF